MGGRGAMSSGGKHSASSELSKAEKNAVFVYTTSKYTSINGKLRKGKALNASEKNTVANLDNAMKKSKLSKDTTLYRGTSPEGLGINKNIREMSAADVKSLIGKTIKDSSYTSTSKNQKAADNFSGRGDYKGNVKIVITAKKGRKALDVGNNSNFGDREQEVILPRGANIKITGARRMLGNLTVYAEY